MTQEAGNPDPERHFEAAAARASLTDPPGVRLIGTLRGHNGTVGDIAWSRDARLLATTSADETVTVWNGVTYQHAHTITGHRQGARSVAFDRHSQILATGSEDGIVRLWEVDSWRLLRTLHLETVLGYCDSLAFSPRQNILAAAGRHRAVLIDAANGKVLHQLHDWGQFGNEYVEQITFDPLGATVATGGEDGLVLRWDSSDGRLLEHRTSHAGPVVSVAFSPDGQLLVSGGEDNAIKIRDLSSPELLRTLEGHTDSVLSVSFLAGGRLLASKSRDGTVRLWNCSTWGPAGVLSEPGQRRWLPRLAFHPSEPLLATAGSDEGKRDDAVVHLWDLDPGLLLGQAPQPSVAYASAKIVLVGESGVGKTGLGYRLAHGAFREHPSTHGQQFWLLDELAATRADGAQCEAILWDLAGQPDYRLVHALFLDDADMALVVFDSARDDDPLRGVDYWVRHLRARQSAADGTAATLILVAARSDRGDARLTSEEISLFCAERGIQSYVTTSALTGTGLAELVSIMRGAVDWDNRPTTITTATFKWIKDALLTLKESRGEQVLVSQADLRVLLERDDPNRRFSDAELAAAVGHLGNHGYVALLRTSRGELRILLAPELLNNVAASIVLEARRNPRGLGSLEEQRVLSGEYAFPELRGMSAADSEILLDSAVARFLAHNVCFRETDPLTSRVYLVFPELINLKRPAVRDAEPVSDGAAYSVTGSVQNVYASLVVLLGYTDVFTRTNQWRNQAEYVVGTDLVCGFRLEAEREGELELVLYFGTSVGESARTLFQGLFESFLARRDLTVRRFMPVTCTKGHQLNRAAVREQLTDGNSSAFCMRCGDRVALPRADVPIQGSRQHGGALDVQHRAAEQRSRFEQALFRFNASFGAGAAAQPTCFISYAWGDAEQEQWVERELATDLAKAGITVILDRWENSRIGASVPRFVERAASADWVVVVGTPAYLTKYTNDTPMRGFVTAAEGDIIGHRLTGAESSKRTVLPVILDGTEETALPPLLRGRVYADFRVPEQYFLSAFRLILSVHEILPTEPTCRGLIDFIRESPR